MDRVTDFINCSCHSTFGIYACTQAGRQAGRQAGTHARTHAHTHTHTHTHTRKQSQKQNIHGGKCLHTIRSSSSYHHHHHHHHHCSCTIIIIVVDVVVVYSYPHPPYRRADTEFRYQIRSSENLREQNRGSVRPESLRRMAAVPDKIMSPTSHVRNGAEQTDRRKRSRVLDHLQQAAFC